MNVSGPDGVADFTTSIAGSGASVGVVVSEGGEPIGVSVPGGVPVAVAELSTEPASTSSSVTT